MMSANSAASLSQCTNGNLGQPEGQLELRQDPDLWFSDGNIVIAVKDKGNVTRGMRCHQSILSKHSSVFEGMFALKAPPDSERYEDIPLVFLPDSYADMRELLQMLYDPAKNFPKIATAMVPLGWQPIQGALRLSAKYEFSDLHARLVEVLESYWPPTLWEWEDICVMFRQRYVAEPCPNPVSIILIAEESRVPSVLPSLYYHVHKMWYISGPSKGSYMANNWGAEHLVNSLKGLEASHLLRLVGGRECLRVVVTELMVKELPENLGLCDCGSLVCSSALHQWWQVQISPVCKGSSYHSVYIDPLGTLVDMDRRLGKPPLEDSL